MGGCWRAQRPVYKALDTDAAGRNLAYLIIETFTLTALAFLIDFLTPWYRKMTSTRTRGKALDQQVKVVWAPERAWASSVRRSAAFPRSRFPC